MRKINPYRRLRRSTWLADYELNKKLKGDTVKDWGKLLDPDKPEHREIEVRLVKRSRLLKKKDE